MKRLHAGIMQGLASQLWLDERLNSLMESLLQTRQQDLIETESLPFRSRTATRIEDIRTVAPRKRLYRILLLRGRWSIAAGARWLVLSRHHFLRLFKEAFRLTPHRYLTGVRLRKARHLVEVKAALWRRPAPVSASKTQARRQTLQTTLWPLPANCAEVKKQFSHSNLRRHCL